MYETACKIEDNLEMYWSLSKNDKKVTDFRQEMASVEDAQQAFLTAHDAMHSNLQSASLAALSQTQQKKKSNNMFSRFCIGFLLHTPFCPNSQKLP